MSKKTVVLRFRDLVTENGGTILEHNSLIRSQGMTWWGWMMRPQEQVPRVLLCSLRELIVANGKTTIFLFDTGLTRLYRCDLAKVAVAPKGTRIASPEPEKTPEYYNRGRYPAWFGLGSIEEYRGELTDILYDSFPTQPDNQELQRVHDQPLRLERLRHHDVTLWAVRVPSMQ